MTIRSTLAALLVAAALPAAAAAPAPAPADAAPTAVDAVTTASVPAAADKPCKPFTKDGACAGGNTSPYPVNALEGFDFD